MNTKVEKTNALSKHPKRLTPLAISRALGKTHSYILLHPSQTQDGYHFFTVFWFSDKDNAGESVGKSWRDYKTKKQCITAIKKLSDCFPGISKFYSCFDHLGHKVDIEIKYDVKKLL